MINKKIAEAKRKYWEKHIKVSDYLRDIFDGMIASDGHVRLGKHQSSVLYTCKYKEVVDYIAKIYDANGVAYKISKNYSGYKKPNQVAKKFTSYSIRTCSYVELNSFRSRWYKGNKKVIPKDIRINKEVLTMWYIGDGRLKNSRHSFSAEFGTYGFELSDVIRVAKKIVKLLRLYMPEVRVYKSEMGYVINLNPYATIKFLDFLGDCPVSCYSYKWDKTWYKHRESNYLLINRK